MQQNMMNFQQRGGGGNTPAGMNMNRPSGGAPQGRFQSNDAPQAGFQSQNAPQERIRSKNNPPEFVVSREDFPECFVSKRDQPRSKDFLTGSNRQDRFRPWKAPPEMLQKWKAPPNRFQSQFPPERIIIPSKAPERLQDRYKKAQNLQEYVETPDREPIVGLEHILEYRVQTRVDKIENYYFCDLCDLTLPLIPIIEHLLGVKHRTNYMQKMYPFVIAFLPENRDYATAYLRRMAEDIERVEGLQMFRTDSTLRGKKYKPPKVSNKPGRLNSRWETDEQRGKKMDRALEYLKSFTIDNETEAATVSSLQQKLNEDLMQYAEELQEQAEFQARVTRAKDVAANLVQEASVQKMPPKDPAELNAEYVRFFKELMTTKKSTREDWGGNEGPQSGQEYEEGPPPGRWHDGSGPWHDERLSGPGRRGPPTDVDMTQRPHPPPANQRPFGQGMPTSKTSQHTPKEQDPPLEPSAEEVQFIRQLMSVLSGSPDGSPTGQSQKSATEMMVKSLLNEKRPSEKTSANQPSLTSVEKELYQQLMTMMGKPSSPSPSNPKPTSEVKKVAPVDKGLGKPNPSHPKPGTLEDMRDPSSMSNAAWDRPSFGNVGDPQYGGSAAPYPRNVLPPGAARPMANRFHDPGMMDRPQDWTQGHGSQGPVSGPEISGFRRPLEGPQLTQRHAGPDRPYEDPAWAQKRARLDTNFVAGP